MPFSQITPNPVSNRGTVTWDLSYNLAASVGENRLGLLLALAVALELRSGSKLNSQLRFEADLPHVNGQRGFLVLHCAESLNLSSLSYNRC